MRIFDTRPIIERAYIIAYAMKVKGDTFISYYELKQILDLIYKKLKERGLLDNYRLGYDIEFQELVRIALYYDHVFGINHTEEIIFLQAAKSLDKLVESWELDKTLQDIIKEYYLIHE